MCWLQPGCLVGTAYVEWRWHSALKQERRNEARSDQLDGPENADGYDVFLAMVTFVLTPLPLIYCNWKHAQKLSAEGEAGALEARLQYLIANGGASDIVSMKDDLQITLSDLIQNGLIVPPSAFSSSRITSTSVSWKYPAGGIMGIYTGDPGEFVGVLFLF